MFISPSKKNPAARGEEPSPPSRRGAKNPAARGVYFLSKNKPGTPSRVSRAPPLRAGCLDQKSAPPLKKVLPPPNFSRVLPC